MAERRIAVAYSGGRDSTALLDATLSAAVDHGVVVVALHVHHGLRPEADAWLEHCAARCRAWADEGLPVLFVHERLATRPGKGESVEAWARKARYRALKAMAVAHRVSLVLLAHHRRDQAETLLLQALRGGGVAGLASMPRSVEREGIRWLRPWLDKPRAEIEAYLRRRGLDHIEDDSNADPRFARNRLRQDVWPALTAAFPQAETALATAAGWAQEAAAVLAEVATGDLLQVATVDGLRVGAWQGLSAARRSNVLRAWLAREQGFGAPASLVARLLSELPVSRSAEWPCGDHTLRLYRGVLRMEGRAPVLVQPEQRLCIHRAGVHRLHGWAGDLQVTRVREHGVPLAWLAELDLVARRGGERFQAGPGRPPRSLKKQYQDAGVPASARNGPLVYSGGQLVFVPGLGLDARMIGLPGQPMVTLEWLARDDAG